MICSEPGRLTGKCHENVTENTRWQLSLHWEKIISVICSIMVLRRLGEFHRKKSSTNDIVRQSACLSRSLLGGRLFVPTSSCAWIPYPRLGCLKEYRAHHCWPIGGGARWRLHLLATPAFTGRQQGDALCACWGCSQPLMGWGGHPSRALGVRSIRISSLEAASTAERGGCSFKGFWFGAVLPDWY